MEHADLRQRMQALAMARQPLAEWISGAQALALLHGALRAGILDAVRTPRPAAEIAAARGIEAERATDICRALAAYGIVRREGDAYRLADAFTLLASPEALQPLPAVVARGLAEARRLEAIGEPDQAYGALSPEELLVFARGDSVDPASPLRRGLTFLSQPELRHTFETGARHLELGCGIGGGLLSILNTYPRVTAVGVEVEAELLAVARRHAEALGLADRVEWRHGDAREVADAAGFDTLAWSQYYFPADTRAATLAAALRALRPGGYLLASMLSDPPVETDQEGPAGRAYALTRLLYRSWGVLVLTAEELRSEIEAAGFAFVGIIESPQRRRLLARRPPA